MESLQVPPPPHDYAGIGSQTPGAGLDQHTQVLADPENGDHPQVCVEIHYYNSGLS